MKQIIVPVVFNGYVTTLVPDHLNDKDAKLIAEKKALACLLATMENTDCGEAQCDACDEYSEECSEPSSHTAEDDWDAVKFDGVGGTWTHPEDKMSDIGYELADGGCICFPDDDGEIRRIDVHGNTEEVRCPSDDDYDEWKVLFDK
jgi:hypothetical protein